MIHRGDKGWIRGTDPQDLGAKVEGLPSVRGPGPVHTHDRGTPSSEDRIGVCGRVSRRESSFRGRSQSQGCPLGLRPETFTEGRNGEFYSDRLPELETEHSSVSRRGNVSGRTTGRPGS